MSIPNELRNSVLIFTSPCRDEWGSHTGWPGSAGSTIYMPRTRALDTKEWPLRSAFTCFLWWCVK